MINRLRILPRVRLNPLIRNGLRKRAKLRKDVFIPGGRGEEPARGFDGFAHDEDVEGRGKIPWIDYGRGKRVAGGEGDRPALKMQKLVSTFRTMRIT